MLMEACRQASAQKEEKTKKTLAARMAGLEGQLRKVRNFRVFK